MTQTSPKRPVRFRLSDPDGASVTFKPATGPQRAEYTGSLGAEGANVGALAVSICRRHVLTAEGFPEAFRRGDPEAFDSWEPKWFLEVMTEIVTGAKLSEPDMGN